MPGLSGPPSDAGSNGASIGAVMDTINTGMNIWDFARQDEWRDEDISRANRWRNQDQARQDSAHQREVADLKAAGLNPLLSATGAGSQSTSAVTSAGNHNSKYQKSDLANTLMTKQSQLTKHQIDAADYYKRWIQPEEANLKSAEVGLKQAEYKAANANANVIEDIADKYGLPSTALSGPAGQVIAVMQMMDKFFDPNTPSGKFLQNMSGIEGFQAIPKK